MRYADEFVKHKILDAVGDLYLLGYPIIGSYKAHKAGHALNNRLLRALLADKSAWEIATFASAESGPAGSCSSRDSPLDGAAFHASRLEFSTSVHS